MNKNLCSFILEQQKFEPPPDEAPEAPNKTSTAPESKEPKEKKDVPFNRSISKEQNLQIIRQAIEEMPEFEVQFLDDSVSQCGPSQEENHEANVATADVPTTQENVQEEPLLKEPSNKEDEEDVEVTQHVTADPTIFDDLDWEVECTSDVWRTLQNKKVSSDMKERIIGAIQLLASGEWSTRLCKKLKGAPDTMQLFEAKLSRDSRLIWELAIAFSPRRSETAERRLGVESSGEDLGTITL